MKTFGFFILGQKGYRCLADFLIAFGTSNIAYVCSSRDLNVREDYYREIKLLCDKKSIQFYERSRMKNLIADYKIAIGWRWIISEDSNLIVFHDSLLPKYRGFSPLVNALINGEKEVGVTALRASDKYDQGPIIGQKSMKINYPIKINEAIKEISILYSDLLITIGANLIDGNSLDERVQNNHEASFSPWRNEDDYYINWHECSDKVIRFVDATGYPYAGAKSKIGSAIVRVSEVEKFDDVIVEERKSHVGKILFMNGDKPIVICGSGLVKIISIFDEKGNSLVGKIPFRTKFGN